MAEKFSVDSVEAESKLWCNYRAYTKNATKFTIYSWCLMAPNAKKTRPAQNT